MPYLSIVQYAVIELRENIMVQPRATVAKVSLEDQSGKIISIHADSTGIALLTRTNVINADTADFENVSKLA